MSCSKKFFAVLFYLWSSLAWAGVNCTDLPNFVPGNIADALAVNARFANVVSCFSLAAQTGNNNDITALFALTSPINTAQGGSSIYLGGTSSGTNAYTIGSLSPSIGFSLTRGLSVLFTVGTTNTGPSTLAITTPAIAATNIFRPTPSGPQALVDGELISGNLALVIYDGTQFQLAWTGAQSGGFGPLTSLDTGGATADLGTVASHNVTFTIGSAGRSITSFGSTASVTYPVYRLNFATALTLNNGGSLILPGGSNIVTVSGDNAVALYLGGSTWQVIHYNRANGTAAVSPTPLCGFSGLQVTNDANTIISWQFNSSVLINPTGNVPIFSGAKSGTINTSLVGAAGLDVAGPGNNNFVYLYAIYNSASNTWNGVGSLNTPSTGPSPLPGGYAAICYMGAMKTNGAHLLYGSQISGNEAFYVSGTATTATLPLITSGVNGSMNCGTTTPAYTALTVRGNSGAGIWMPSTAVAGDYILTDNFGGGGAAGVILAPNISYTGLGGASTNPPPLVVSPTLTAGTTKGRMMFEGATNTVQYCSTTNQGAVTAYGWKDAVNAN
jgi:hypothetical protein